MKTILFQLVSAHNHFKGSWTREEAERETRCSTVGVDQETANFDNCVSGDVLMNYTAQYDINSIMHYDLKE